LVPDRPSVLCETWLVMELCDRWVLRVWMSTAKAPGDCLGFWG
jgi:hypothetical protein